MKRLYFSLLLIFALGVTSAPAQTPRTAKDYIKRAATRYLKGDLAGAIDDYSKALDAEPRAAEVYVKRGGARRAKGDLNGAIEDFNQAYDIDPLSVQNDRSVAEAYSNRGFIRTNKLDMPGAIYDFNKALECYQGNPDLYFKRGRARLIDGDLKGAIADYTDGLALKPETSLASLAYASRGYAHMLQGNEAEARKDFDQSTRVNKDGKIFLHLHLMTLDEQLKEMKRLRVRDQQRVT
ncbi:MAG TPA: tetratricopeptide repeat protein [Pyrinomonadaceae bacterium]|nr:tetratricopeptide repeat protein [Pyrinomonadaceae bacterium]